MAGPLAPAIKWSGSKRSVAGQLHRLWPREVESTATYFEPFVGGGAMLPGRPVARARAGDTVGPLIELWNAIASQPLKVADHYRHVWKARQERGHTVFYEVRDRFNEQGSPLDLMVLSRMCVNGLIRFNRKGEFNNSLHHTRPGVAPHRLEATLLRWSEALSGTRFATADFTETLRTAAKGDLVFLDPPYVGNKGRYHPRPFEFEALWATLRELNERQVWWMLTLDGRAGGREYDASAVPGDVWETHLQVETGNSPFTRLMGTSLDAVWEGVYLNFEPPGEVLLGAGLRLGSCPPPVSIL